MNKGKKDFQNKFVKVVDKTTTACYNVVVKYGNINFLCFEVRIRRAIRLRAEWRLI